MLEKEVERPVVLYAKSIGVKSYKLNGDGDRGKPDRIFMKNGVILFMEIKRPGGKPRKLQIKELRDLLSMGFYATWVDNIEDAKKILNAVYA